jgi:hypothetical protein
MKNFIFKFIYETFRFEIFKSNHMAKSQNFQIKLIKNNESIDRTFKTPTNIDIFVFSRKLKVFYLHLKVICQNKDQKYYQ